MKKFLKYAAVIVIVLALLAVGGMYGVAEYRRADPAPEAMTAMASDATVSVAVDQGLPGTVVFKPASGTPTAGLIVYPGASCDIRGYAPVLRRIAAAGYQVVVLQMPFDFAIWAKDRALEVPSAFPDVKTWALAGHSMGGAMASQFVHDHPDAMAGLILWDSYPPEAGNLSNYSKPVWNIARATPEGRFPETFESKRPLYPTNSVWVPVKGGIHMYFGSFTGGAYKEQWEPSISREAQQEQIVAETIKALQAMG